MVNWISLQEDRSRDRLVDGHKDRQINTWKSSQKNE